MRIASTPEREFTSIADHRDRERLMRAKIAMRLGLSKSDVMMIFDLSETAYARLAQEVGR